MLEDADTLDAVFSFLSQIELSTALAPLDDGQQEVVDDHDLLAIVPGGVSNADEVELDVLCHDEQGDADSPPVEASSDRSEDTGKRSGGSPEGPNKAKPRRTRISRKQQIATLRGEVGELNGQLQSLRQPGRDLMRTRQGNTGQLLPRRASMWQEIASRQLERRETSEEENAKLREMLQIQIHEARNLRRVLKRRTKIEKMEDMLGMKRRKMLACSVPEDNPQVFGEMLQDADELYVGVEALFHDKGLYDLPCPGRRRDAKRNVSNGLFLDLTQRHLVPFDLRTTEAAMWKVMSFQGLKDVQDFAHRVQFHVHHVEQSNDTIKTSFFVETANLGDVRGAQFRMIVKKYVENDRVVLICKDLMEPILHEKGITSGFFTRTTLRIVIRGEDSVASPSGQTSHIDSHFSATRHDQGLPVSRAIRTPANLDVGIEAWDEAISRIAHQVESLAIDEACTTPRSPVYLVD
ncbi:hypothetical protein PHYPSEUDO_010135 [Phytophthora pseudosyringae]|uniref:M96 mating-specific protein family n=1 Tax=Phytophthora pseudosyringae TaxID=221518 RepID=A0A8T1VDU9_9STRA|nr:hypothetical protein PHYPSEUDO_010135 [Phytophthora pseudosyringae]